MNALSNTRLALSQPDLKRSYNRTLFKEVAPRYDLITRVLSFGRDTAWKKWMLQHLPPDHINDALDLACGTGDITRELSKLYPEAKVIGLDLTPEMLSIARSKSSAGLTYMEGDMMQTGLNTESFDLITGGYALRNAPDLNAALREIHRLLRPGGRAAFLDFSAPRSVLLRKTQYGVLWIWGALWGLFLHGNPRVYAYIARGLAQFPDRQKFRQHLLDHKLIETDHKQFMLGMIEVIICKKK